MEVKWTLLLAGVLVAGGFAITHDSSPVETASTADQSPEAAENDGNVENRFLLDGDRPSVHTEIGEGSEPMILADPANSDRLWIGDTSGMYRTTNGGESFEELRNPFTAQADGIHIVRDESGTLYATTTNAATNMVAASEDGGDTWQSGTTNPTPFARPVDGGGVADRPWLAAAGDGRLAMLWNPGSNPPGTRCVASVDGGDTWPDRGAFKSTIIAGPPEFAGSANDRALFWSISGTVYRLPDVPLTGSVRHVCQFSSTSEDVIDAGKQPMYPTAAHGDTVFTAAPSSDNGDIVVAGAPQWPDFGKIVLDPATDNGTQLAQNTFVTLSANANKVAVAWYGTQTDGDFTSNSFDGDWNVYLAEITNFFAHTGETMTCSSQDVDCTRMTTQPNHEGGICIGGAFSCGGTDRDLLDYFGVDISPDGAVHVAYADDVNSSQTMTSYAQVSTG